MTDTMLFAFPSYLEAKRPIPKLPSSEDDLSASSNSTYLSKRYSVSSKSTQSSRSSKATSMGFSAESKFGSLSKASTRSSSTHPDLVNSGSASYGYGGYDTMSPFSALEPIWWDNKRIEEAVTPNFLQDKMPNITGAGLKERLEQPMSFGYGLTDTTYCEWVIEKAQRFFLILLQMGIPEQIFGIVDDSWDDEDLPIALDQIPRLRLSYPADPVMDRRFFRKQFYFLLKDIQRGGHVVFENDDVVPLENEQKRSTVSFTQCVEDRVSLPRGQGNVLLRRRIPLGEGSGSLREANFMSEVESMKSISHAHIVEVFASYTFQNAGYLLQSPACDNTLKSFIQSPPSCFKILNREQRRRQLLGWCHCLSDALAYLHDKGITHEDIRPKSILLEGTNIYFADFGNSRNLDPTPRKAGGDPVEIECYEYGAPELWTRTAISVMTSNPTPSESSSPPVTPSSLPKTPMSLSFPTSYESVSRGSVSSTSTVNDFRASSFTNSPNFGEWMSRNSTRGKSSVFSLACIFLDILTFNFKRKPSAFSSHRSQKRWRATSRHHSTVDVSFHANLPRVSTWIEQLDHDAEKAKDGEDKATRQILNLCKEMLQQDPVERPGTSEVTDRLWTVLKAEGGMPHCGSVGKSPGREHLEGIAQLNQYDNQFEWPWQSQSSPHFVKDMHLTG